MKEVNLEGLELRLVLSDRVITGGFTAKCQMDDSAATDWAQLNLSDELAGLLKGVDLAACGMELGNAAGYEMQVSGSGVISENVLTIRSRPPVRADQLAAVFLDCTLQEAAKYYFAAVGITDYIITDQDFGRQQQYQVDAGTWMEALQQLNAVYGAGLPYYSDGGRIYYGILPNQEDYCILTDDNILDIRKEGLGWTAEIIPVPFLHVRNLVNIQCEEFTGQARITKCVLSGDESEVDMYICFVEV